MPTLTGGCLCGAVRYSLEASVTGLRTCHCRNCQKSSGAGGTVNAVVPSDSLKFTKGSTRRYDDSATLSGRTLSRHFCGDCGSPIYSQRTETPEMMTVRAGTLDDSSGMKITGNIWTRSARHWGYIAPGTTQHPGQPDAPKLV